MQKRIYELLLASPCTPSRIAALLTAAFDVARDDVGSLEQSGNPGVRFELSPGEGAYPARLSVYVVDALAARHATDEQLARALAKLTSADVLCDLPEGHALQDVPTAWARVRPEGDIDVVHLDA